MTTQARQKMLLIDHFDGIHNKKDTLRTHESGGNNIAEAGMTEAMNVDVDDEGKLEKAQGFTQVNNANITDAFATLDEQTMYTISAAVLNELDATFNMHPIHSFSAVSLKHAQWVEINNEVYCSYGDEHIIISRNGTVHPWGITPPALPAVVSQAGGSLPPGQFQVAVTYLNRTTGQESGALGALTIQVAEASSLAITVTDSPPAGYVLAIYLTTSNGDTLYRMGYMTTPGTMTWDGPESFLAYPLRYFGMDAPPPVIDQLVAYKGRIYATQYFPEENVTGVFRSQPLGFEHWDLLNEVDFIEGEVLSMVASNDGILIGTEDTLYGYDGTKIDMLAEYGAVRGTLGRTHKGTAYMWTERGLVSAFPFEEMTYPKTSVQPGKYGSAVVIELDGYERFVAVVEDGGTAYNPSEA